MTALALRLPPLLREVLILRDLEVKCIEAIAAKLGITEAAVKSRLARASSANRTSTACLARRHLRHR
jgi:DNA-directed RNA polymerase specialized sigma24 family protein